MKWTTVGNKNVYKGVLQPGVTHCFTANTKSELKLYLRFGWTCPSHAEGWCTDTDAVWSSPPAPPQDAPAPDEKSSL